jgi:hypothetical protein
VKEFSMADYSVFDEMALVHLDIPDSAWLVQLTMSFACRVL